MKTLKLKNNLASIPGVGKSIAEDLQNIGIRSVANLKGKDLCSKYVARIVLYVARIVLATSLLHRKPCILRPRKGS